jgi:heme oxygenase
LLAAHLPDFAGPRSKLAKLRADLVFLGTDPASVALCPTLPACLGWPQALGGLYVTEGATLGGQIISRHLEQTLGLSARRGAAFFASYGLQVGAMWRAFCAILQAETTAEEDEVVIGAARQTFIAIHEWLSGSR